MEGSHEIDSSSTLTQGLDSTYVLNYNKDEVRNTPREENDEDLKEIFEIEKDDKDDIRKWEEESSVHIKIETPLEEQEEESKTEDTEVETDSQDKEEIDISDYLCVKIEEQGTSTEKRSLHDVSVESNLGITDGKQNTSTVVNILPNYKDLYENVILQDKLTSRLQKRATVIPSTSLDKCDKEKQSVCKKWLENNSICHVCQYNCFSKDALKRHLRTHVVPKVFICDLCGHKCSRKYHLGKHIQFKHTKERNFSCPMCPYKFVTKSDLNKHFRKHTGEKPYVCDLCDFRCAKKFYLKSHVQYKHTKEKSFSCHMCLYQCVTKYNLDEHIRTHTGEKPYLCTICDYRCSCRANLNSHMRTKHTKYQQE